MPLGRVYNQRRSAMKSRISITSMVLLLALFNTGALNAQIVAPDRALGAVATNDNLLITPIHSAPVKRQITVPREPDDSFEDRMASNGWDVSQTSNRHFENFRKVVSRQQLLRVEDEINAKYFQSRRNSRAIEASA